MNTIAENNKRITRNTMYLYVRMAIMMGIGFYTSRMVLNALGVDDYGINNVVGGFVSMLTFFNGLLSQGSSRFITFHLGTGDKKRLKDVFAACITIHAIMALLVLLFSETIGLWFVNHKLNIDPTRMEAANCVYQFGVASTVLGVLQTPYNAAVVAHEKMSAFAWMSVFDASSKLAIVFLLFVVPYDKLSFYAFFYFCTSLTNAIINFVYCFIKFPECTPYLGFDKPLYKEMMQYTGWNLIGAFAFMANGQGVNILLNLFFGTVVNASRGIAMTLTGIVGQFVGSFQSAAAPQIIKYHSIGDEFHMNELIHNTAKYSSYLIIILAIPMFIEAEELLMIWLGQVPPYSVWFVRLGLLQTLVTAIDTPVGRGIHAFGWMKLPNLTSAFIYMAILPITYIALRLGASPVTSYWVILVAYPMALLCDLWILKRYSGFKVFLFIKDVVLRNILIFACVLPIPTMIHIYMQAGIIRTGIVFLTSALISSTIIYYFCIPKNIRQMILLWIKKKFKYSTE